jgi:hypothetical protein
MKAHFTESMMGLRVSCSGIDYILTGYRYFDVVNFLYWYETTGEVWLMGGFCEIKGD